MLRIIFLLSLTLLWACKGTRFYWESKLQVKFQNPSVHDELIKKFSLTDNLSTWHPVFGKYCSALPSNQAQLFVCWKNNEIRIVSSYNGALKGDAPVRKKQATVEKYLRRISSQDGYQEHQSILEFVKKNYAVTAEEERLLTYGRGSLMIKSELEE